MIRVPLNCVHKPQTCPRCGKVSNSPGAHANHFQYGGCGVTSAELFAAKIDKTSHAGGCWLWLGFLNHDGYGRLGPKKGVRTGGRAHKVMWEMERGPVPDGMEVMHKCDTRACVRPDHLQLGSHDENMADCYGKLRHVHGERSQHAKLTAAQVVEIRSKYRRTMSGNRTVSSNSKELAAEYGVGPGAIAHAALGHTWRYVK